MAKQADSIIQVNVAISAAGLGFANFGSAMIFAAPAEAAAVPVPALDKYKTYQSVQEVATDYPESTETYKAASKFLGGTPKMRSIMIWATNATDASFTATLNKARNVVWWYQTFLTAGAYAVPSTVLQVADWCEVNSSFFPNCQTGASCAKIRDQNDTSNIAHKLTALGYRHSETFAHATDPYAGIAYLKHFSAVNYSGDNTTITGEFKKSPGVVAEDVTGSEIAAMENMATRATYYAVVEQQGSQDVGRWLNTLTHSTYGEYTDDVWNLDACVNSIVVGLYNTLGRFGKVPQTPRGQAVLIARARAVGQQYIDNGYLGPRIYTDPDSGEEGLYTEGFEILTKPEDILTISDEDRNARFGAPIKMRLFRAGAIHKAIVDLTVF